MPKTSAGLLLYRRREQLEVFLVHPGGPYWMKKDEGAWSLPKGELDETEDPLEAARRELTEETGLSVRGEFVALEPLKQRGGKTILAWAIETDCDPASVQSNLFSIEWPPRSGIMQEFPEVDRAEWFPLDVARKRISRGQTGFLDQLQELVASDGEG